MPDVFSGQALQGVKEISAFMRWSVSKTYSMLPELRRANVIYDGFIGRPPRQKPCAFPFLLMAWTREKAKKGERV